MCRYAQFYAFISVIELPRIPAYRPKSEYKQFINELKGMLEDLQVKIHPHAFEYVRGQMGIKDLDDLNTLITLPKDDIDYNKFDKQNASDENNLI